MYYVIIAVFDRYEYGICTDTIIPSVRRLPFFFHFLCFPPKVSLYFLLLFVFLVLRGNIVNRTCGIHKNLYIKPFLLTMFGPINYGPP